MSVMASSASSTDTAYATDCSSVCNITRRDWCENFLLGLKAISCGATECVANLCEEVQVCEEGYRGSKRVGVTQPGFCPTIFDGWKCIQETPSGQNATFPCPHFHHLNFDHENIAYRSCSEEGRWWDEAQQKPYSNYGACPDFEGFEWANTINKVYIGGYSLSLVFLVLAKTILLCFRSLRCTRNTIHLNLFAATIMNNISWINWYAVVVYQFDSADDWTGLQAVGCKAQHAIMHYFMVTTYAWMLCEGFHVFVILYKTFVSEEKVKWGLVVFGWGVPLVLVATYVTLRANFDDEYQQEPETVVNLNRLCWLDDVGFNWIYKAPCIASVLINLGFLCAIAFVLVAKLRDDASDRATLIKTTKAIFFLTPLFGLHNLLSAFKPEHDEVARKTIEMISAISISFQGTVIAILFCFVNSEVIVQLKRLCCRQPLAPQSLALTQYTRKSLSSGSVGQHLVGPASRIKGKGGREVQLLARQCGANARTRSLKAQSCPSLKVNEDPMEASLLTVSTDSIGKQPFCSSVGNFERSHD